MRNGNIAINSKTTQANLMKFTPVIEHKVYFKNTKFSNQKHISWYYTDQWYFTDQILSPELK